MKQQRGNTAFTLVELMVATAITSLIALAAITLNNAEYEAKMTNERVNHATMMAREFLDQRGKVLAAGWDADYFNKTIDLFDFTDTETSEMNTDDVYSTDQIQPPTATQTIPGTGIISYRSIRIPSEGCFGSFKETLTTECVLPPQALSTVDWSTLSVSDLADLRACAPQPDPNTSSADVPCPTGKIPRIKIVRSGIMNSSSTPFKTTFYLPSGNLSGTDGNSVGAALCISINGARRKDTGNPYRDINVKVLTLVRTGNNKIKLLRHEANYPRPKKLIPGKSISPAAVGCDRCTVPGFCLRCTPQFSKCP